MQTDLNFAAVRSVIHEDLRAHARNAVNIQALHIATQLQLVDLHPDSCLQSLWLVVITGIHMDQI